MKSSKDDLSKWVSQWEVTCAIFHYTQVVEKVYTKTCKLYEVTFYILCDSSGLRWWMNVVGKKREEEEEEEKS